MSRVEGFSPAVVFAVDITADNGVRTTGGIRGRLDGSGALALVRRLDPHLVGQLPAQIVRLDLSLVTSFDVPGVNALADLRLRLTRAGGSLELHATTATGRRLLEAVEKN